jgi:hypothetical protein
MGQARRVVQLGREVGRGEMKWTRSGMRGDAKRGAAKSRWSGAMMRVADGRDEIKTEMKLRRSGCKARDEVGRAKRGE